MTVILGLGLIVVAGIMFLRGYFASRRNQLDLKPRDSSPEIAVLIAARDESKVIRGLLESLQKQSVPIPAEDIYVIVESEADPTVAICREFGNTVLLRQDLTKQRKGYALDEAVKQILTFRHYDLYFIFDADNVLTENYIAEMLKTYQQGYDLATGYRNSKNGNANVIAAVSSLTFSMINVISNHSRSRHGANIVFSGTGYYITGDLIDEWRGWPFQSLTEDYELSLYATLHGLTTHYNESAMFYDEQPTKFRQTVDQRVRWIKGYFSARHKYIPLIRAKKHGRNYGSLVKERIGVKPVILAIVGVLILLAGGTIELAVTGRSAEIWQLLLGVVVAVYVILVLVTIVMLRREKMSLSPRIRLGAILFNPIYLVTYIYCAIKALLIRDVKWRKIEHGN